MLLSTERLTAACARVYSDNKDYSATNGSAMNIEFTCHYVAFLHMPLLLYNNNKNNKLALLSTERLTAACARVYSDNKDHSATNGSTMNIEFTCHYVAFLHMPLLLYNQALEEIPQPAKYIQSGDLVSLSLWRDH